eukprot:TRINITY_DN10612_c0_g1_i4.p1 TRINITY_DN10612_c0_g1~~TRINITY_DN10612_c0_g1_i4.p1  ORF type:complete len:130 (+),score=26.77 TRINITY_DN10612_c0_g1_i4:299-688(+)
MAEDEKLAHTIAKDDTPSSKSTEKKRKPVQDDDDWSSVISGMKKSKGAKTGRKTSTPNYEEGSFVDDEDDDEFHPGDFGDHDRDAPYVHRADDGSEDDAPSRKDKPMCKYGATCYRTGAQHRSEFVHPK